jgi:hypothetical protein
MPFTPDDGPARHTKKANTPAAKKQWSTVANKVLDDSGDDGKAIRIANAAVAKRKDKFGLARAPGE